jgi:hypothetical protein
MSTNQGIFESFPAAPAPAVESPFGIAPQSEEPMAPKSPFAAVAPVASPFGVFEGATTPASQAADSSRNVRLPERRKPEPQVNPVDQGDGFGYEAQAKAYHAAAFSYPGVQPMAASPFMVEGHMPQPMQAPGAWPGTPTPNPYAPPGFAPVAQLVGPPPGYAAMAPPQFTPAPPPVQIPSSFAPPVQAAPPTQATPAQAYAAPATTRTAEPQSDSFSIRQLELRAIFGVDREMSEEEILKRARSLPGIRNLARLQGNDLATVESLKHMMTNLGFGGSELRLYSGSTPLEFIREGAVVLAVQTDGGFAPGAREVLMLVARELGRMTH